MNVDGWRVRSTNDTPRKVWGYPSAHDFCGLESGIQASHRSLEGLYAFVSGPVQVVPPDVGDRENTESTVGA